MSWPTSPPTSSPRFSSSTATRPTGHPKSRHEWELWVIREPRRGYGQACLTGLAHVSSPDVVVFLDGDYSDRPEELPRLLKPIADGHADITLGSRLAVLRTPG